jgi:hypothetical protein
MALGSKPKAAAPAAPKTYTQAELWAIVRNTGAKYGVPEYIWSPILQQEQGGTVLNPNARNYKPKGDAKGGPEDSRGLFQINTIGNKLADPKRLYDPVYNANYFFGAQILSSYNKAKQLYPKDPVEQAVYVNQKGQRPFWTADIEQKTRTRAAQAAGIPTPQPGPAPTPFTPDPNFTGSLSLSDIWTKPLDTFKTFGVSIVLIVVGLVFLFLASKSLFLGGK